ncbi:MAG: terminase family protein [Pseudohongiellaceae bacterium]|nr:terminase family protein [Pseudohongiellaceae bacterium]
MAKLSDAQEKELLDQVEDIQRERVGQFNASSVPDVLLPYQKAWHEDRSPVRVLVKSRRIGGTWGCLAAEATLEAAHRNGMNQYYVGYNKEMAAEFIGDCANFAKAYQVVASAISVSLDKSVVDDESKDILRYRIRMASGHEIVALSSKPSNLRGHQGHARLDEAAFHDDLQSLIDAAMAFLIWGGRVDICSTHFGDGNPFNQIIREIEAGKLNYSVHKVTFDDALAQGFYQRICLVKGEIWSAEKERAFREQIYALYGSAADEELGCIPSAGSGAYFTRTLIEQCQEETIPVLRFARPAEWVTDPNRIEEAEQWCNDILKPVIDSMNMGARTVFAQDFGRDGDLSAMRVMQENGHRRWRVGFDLELRKIPFDVQKLIMLFILDHIPLFHHAKFDARGNGQSHAEAALQEYGEQRIDCVMATQKWYAEFFPKYKSAYEDRSILVPKSEDHIADHRRVVLHQGSPKMSEGRDRGSDGFYRHGDVAIAGVLAWAAALEEAEPAAGANVESDQNYPLPSAMESRKRTNFFR